MPKVQEEVIAQTQTFVFTQLGRVVEATNQDEANTIINNP